MSAWKAAILLVCTAFAYVWLDIVTAQPRIAIQARTTIASAPADIPLTITVARDATHRLLVIETLGEEYRRSEVALQGEHSPRLWQRWEKRLPAGCYTFLATVYSASASVGAAQTTPVRVIGDGGDPC